MGAIRAMAAFLLAACGCSMPGQRADFASVDPAERTLAVGRAVRTGDAACVRELIVLLGSDDPAERLAAIRALERLTGQTLGYEHSAGEARRREAVARWEAWERGARTESAPTDASSVPGT